MMRAAVYSGTRNLYPHMVTAAKSLAANSSVEKIYFLIEDDEFPEALPPLIETINVSGQTWFPPGGPNMRSQFTYMALIRCCYGKILPKEVDKVLQLDVDTICVDNIDGLWDIDMGGKWIMAADEVHNSYWKPYGMQYYNIGVAMFNLEAMRKTDCEDRMIALLNSEKLPYVEQDGFNKLYAPRKFMELPVRFNECYPVGYSDDPAIVHYAGFKKWWEDPNAPRREYYRKYRDMTWEEALACRGETVQQPAKKQSRSRKAKSSES